MREVVLIPGTGIGIGCDRMSRYLPPGGGRAAGHAANKCHSNVLSDVSQIIALHEGQLLSACMRLLQVHQLRLEHQVRATRCANVSILVNKIEPHAHGGIKMNKCTDSYSAKQLFWAS